MDKPNQDSVSSTPSDPTRPGKARIWLGFLTLLFKLEDNFDSFHRFLREILQVKMPTLTKLFTMEEASEHNTKDDCWVVIDGKVLFGIFCFFFLLFMGLICFYGCFLFWV